MPTAAGLSVRVSPPDGPKGGTRSAGQPHGNSGLCSGGYVISRGGGQPGNSRNVVFPMYCKSAIPILLV
jgi:hypothetical protein